MAWLSILGQYEWREEMNDIDSRTTEAFNMLENIIRNELIDRNYIASKVQILKRRLIALETMIDALQKKELKCLPVQQSSG